MRNYATTIIVGFLIVALSVLGLRWHALAQRANVQSPAAATFYSYAPPKRGGDSGSVPSGNSGQTTSSSSKGRGVSPSKAPTKPTPPPTDSKPKKSEHHSARKVLPKPHSININTATQTQLEQLPGIGPSIASRIISYRNEHGKFSSVDGLDEVKGIGPKKLADIAQYCYVD